MARDTHQAPTHRAYTVIKRGEGQDDFWLNIGAAFAHQDGKGFNIVLQALPIDAKIVVREPDVAEQEAPARETARSGSRSRQGNAGRERGR
jgi:hypothetical protein